MVQKVTTNFTLRDNWSECYTWQEAIQAEITLHSATNESINTPPISFIYILKDFEYFSHIRKDLDNDLSDDEYKNNIRDYLIDREINYVFDGYYVYLNYANPEKIDELEELFEFLTGVNEEDVMFEETLAPIFYIETPYHHYGSWLDQDFIVGEPVYLERNLGFEDGYRLSELFYHVTKVTDDWVYIDLIATEVYINDDNKPLDFEEFDPEKDADYESIDYFKQVTHIKFNRKNAFECEFNRNQHVIRKCWFGAFDVNVDMHSITVPVDINK